MSQADTHPETFLVCFATTVLIFFIAGLLYLLRFERVDNLGAYRIPPETGLLIPSGFDSYALHLRPSALTVSATNSDT